MICSRMMRWLGLLVLLAACKDNPNIDGTQVAPIGNPDAGDIPTCAQICERLTKLCGYAPTSDCTDDEAGGYCDTSLVDSLGCMGQAASCQEAWACTENVAPPDDDASVDAASE